MTPASIRAMDIAAEEIIAHSVIFGKERAEALDYLANILRDKSLELRGGLRTDDA